MRLSTQTLATLPASVQRPGYDRTAQRCGIVHFGIGAFHRAHQAVYTDDAMAAGDSNWAITGVSLRSRDVAEQMNPQDGLFTCVVRSAEGPEARVIGSVQAVIVAGDDPDAVVAAIAAPDTHIITFTVTEKGYCRAPDGTLDPAQAHDGSLYRFLHDGLHQRRVAGQSGLTLLSCDNLAHNGAVLKRLLNQYLRARDESLADWVEETCAFPSSMVDRIVPATTEGDREAFATEHGAFDAALVLTEPFRQWVIEDQFAGPRPRWEGAGAQIVADVAPYEMAKLRMLNGAHSALAYLGLERGYSFVHEAVADPKLRSLVTRLMEEEAAPSVTPASGMDLTHYAEALIARFDNPTINHRLVQIAMDGSQKIPQRWLATLAVHQEANRTCPAILTAIGAWLRHLVGPADRINDPMAAQLQALIAGQPLALAARAVFGSGGPMSSVWEPSPEDLAIITA